MAKTTTGLAVISPDWESAKRVVKDYGSFFDVVYLQLNGKNRNRDNANVEGANVKLSFFKWTGNFADARNALLEDIDTDYFMWLDTDDEILHPENIPELVAHMVARKIDALFLPYEYAFNGLGECIARHYRERIINRHHDFIWRSPVHETLISQTENARMDRADDVVIRHIKDSELADKSAARNHKLLLKADKTDPRTWHYLGLSHFSRGEFKQSIKAFQKHISASGWDDETFRSWFWICRAYEKVEDWRSAIQSGFEMAKIFPDRPEPYLLLAECYLEVEQAAKSIEWLKVCLRKEPPKATMAVQDPTLYTYQPLILGALAYMQLGKVKEAYQMGLKVAELSPKHEFVVRVMPVLERAYEETQAIEKARWLISYAKHHKGDGLQILGGLPKELQADVRLSNIRTQLLPIKTWGKRSIVFFSGPAANPWGPDYLADGAGGSEEAVIYLSWQLVKLGWEVTVYCDREREITDGGVHWKPWTLMNPNDAFNIFVAWRTPDLAAGVKAKAVLCDVHDVLPEKMVYNASWVNVFMFKSHYHRNLYPELDDSRVAVVSNGILRQQFAGKSTRRPHSVGYFSSYDRGLQCLLELWPQIREQVPDATLDIAYGWNSFDAMAAGNPAAMRWKWRMRSKINSLRESGVREHGRLSHEKLAELMKTTQVWAYPTEFTEINCITALKAQQAGMAPVVTDVAALKETVQAGIKVPVDNIYHSPMGQKAFVDATVASLKRPPKIKPMPNVDWVDIANYWNGILSESLSRSLRV